MSTDAKPGWLGKLLPRRRSLWMLIRVRTEQMGITVPLPLFVLDLTLEALEDLFWLADRLVPGLTRRLAIQNARHVPEPFEIRPLIGLCRDLLRELRRYGSWRMVAVEIPPAGPHAKQVRVYIDFI